MTTYSFAELGHYISSIREQAGIKQGELAKRITWSAASLSRVESGERELSRDELERVLAAIGTEQAVSLMERLERNWKVLPAPPLDHPYQEELWRAEQVAGDLAMLACSDDIKASFQRRIEAYLHEVREIGDRVLRRDYSVSFIGRIGVGKSTAITKVAGLEVATEAGVASSVLEVGAGGVTICEVHLYQGPQYGVIVEPCSDDEIRRYVFDFVEHISQANTEVRPAGEGEPESQGISKEIERAIRNMAGLRVRKEKGTDGKTMRRDDAKELSKAHASPRSLLVEVLSLMQLHKRDARHAWYEPSCGKEPLEWLRDTFVEINNGRHPDFTIPRRIEVVVPDQLLPNPDLNVRIVDTKGIDRTAARADLESQLNEPFTLAVLCSGFNDAPGSEARMLLERAREAGIQNLERNACILALPRPEEALAVKDDDGVKVDDVAEGYELKGEQVSTSLEPLGLRSIGVGFFNAREDSVETLRDFINARLQHIRSGYLNSLVAITDSIRDVVANHERAQAEAVLQEAAGHLGNWIDQHRNCPNLRGQIQSSLIAELARAYASTIHAAVRREGDWLNLDYGHQLGHGARVLAASTLGELVKQYQAVADNLATQESFTEAASLISQSKQVLVDGYQQLLLKMQLFGKALYEQELKRDKDFWRACEGEWGQGAGYKDRVATKSGEWFGEERREEINRQVQKLISTEWEKAIGRVEDLF